MPIGSLQAIQGSTLQAVPPPQAGGATPSTPTKALAYDPADANQDGVVTPAEALAYALAHPIAELLKSAQASAATYGASGTAAGQPMSGGLNLNA